MYVVGQLIISLKDNQIRYSSVFLITGISFFFYLIADKTQHAICKVTCNFSNQMERAKLKKYNMYLQNEVTWNFKLAGNGNTQVKYRYLEL